MSFSPDAFEFGHADLPSRSQPALAGLPAWTFPVALGEDELLSSWLCRSAHAHGTRAHAFVALRLPGREVWTRDPDRHGGETLWADLARLAGGDAETYRNASLRPLCDLMCGSNRRVPAQIPLVLHAGIYHRRRRLYGLQFCPDCLGEQPNRFRREWRLAVAVGCRRHGVPLEDGCPACDAPLAPHRAEVGCIDVCTVCGISLSRPKMGGDIPSPILAHAMSLQSRCLRAVAAGHGSAMDFPGSGRDLLDTVRCLASLCTADPIRSAVAEAFGMADTLDGVPSVQLERSRAADRIPILALLSFWMGEWPRSFHAGAKAAGLSQRTFERLPVPPPLRREVGHLATGFERQRKPLDLRVYGRSMLRLRRRDVRAYMEERASRILRCSSPSPRILR